MDIASRREVLQELTIMSGAILLQPVRRWLAQALAVVPLVSPESELTARYPCNAHVVPFSDELREYVQRVAPHKKWS